MHHIRYLINAYNNMSDANFAILACGVVVAIWYLTNFSD